MVERPSGMMNNVDAYAGNMPSDVMSSRFKLGEVFFVGPHLPLRAGVSIVKSLKTPTSDKFVNLVKQGAVTFFYT